MDYSFTGKVEIELDGEYQDFTNDDFIRLAGAPDGAKLIVKDYDLYTEHDFFEDPIWQQIRYDEDDNISLYFYTRLLVLKSEYRNQKFVTQMLQNQIKKATELGFSYFYLYADGGANQDLNGYYSWARLGFNAPIPQGLHLPDFLRNCEDILDIVSNEEGAKWWKENGIPVNMEFDLSTNSKSMKYFEKYVQNK